MTDIPKNSLCKTAFSRGTPEEKCDRMAQELSSVFGAAAEDSRWPETFGEFYLELQHQRRQLREDFHKMYLDKAYGPEHTPELKELREKVRVLRDAYIVLRDGGEKAGTHCPKERVTAAENATKELHMIDVCLEGMQNGVDPMTTAQARKNAPPNPR